MGDVTRGKFGETRPAVLGLIGASAVLLLGAGADPAERVVAEYQAGQSTSPMVFCCSAEGICLPSDTPGCPPQRAANVVSVDPTDGLRLTRPRGVDVAEEERRPQEGDPLGDGLAYLYDHPGVEYVVRGEVISEDPYVDQLHNFPQTRCTMRVSHVFKGSPGPEVVFEVSGARTKGLWGWVSHHPMCSAGEEAIAFLGRSQGRMLALGQDAHYVQTRTPAGESVEFGERVHAFLQADVVGGAQ